MVKTFVPDPFLVEWFTKSLLAPTTEDVAKGKVVTEEQVIARAQYLDCWTPNPQWVSVEVEWTKGVQETLGCESQWSHNVL